VSASEETTVGTTARRLGWDLALGLALASGAAVTYAVTFHPDWIFDPLRYAELMQRGPVRVLLGPQHALGNLLPYLAFRASNHLGYDGRAMPSLAAFAVAGGAVAVWAVFAAAVRLGGSRVAGVLAAGVLASTAFLWRAGGSAGVYGVAAATLAIGWLAAAHYVRRRGIRAAAFLGVACGVALGGHLANVAFVAAALVLVVALEPAGTRLRALGALLGSTALVGAIIFGITAGVATGWSISGMRDWALHPGIGGSTDRSSLVGWGIGGLFPAVAEGQPHVSWLPFGLEDNGHLQVLVTILLLVTAVLRGVGLATRSRTSAVLAAALTLNAGLAFLLASWYQSLRPDYWGMGLVPLAVMAGAGTRVFGPHRAKLRLAGAAATLVLIGGLLAWNASQEVAPSLALSRERGHEVHRMEARIPRAARVFVSPLIAGRLADDGYDAGTGFSSLRSIVDANGGETQTVLRPIVFEARFRPTFVTRKAFSLTSGQADFLGMTGATLWWRLHGFWSFTAVLRIELSGETLYRVRPTAR
jgi:hypothetical protein